MNASAVVRRLAFGVGALLGNCWLAQAATKKTNKAVEGARRIPRTSHAYLWWRWRGFEGRTIGDVLPYFLALILIYLAASVTLPDEVPAEGLDLGQYFDENRSYFWIVYPTYVATMVTLLGIRYLHEGHSVAELWSKYYFDCLWIVAAYAMVFVRRRWVSGAVLMAVLIWLNWGLDWWNRAPDSPL